MHNSSVSKSDTVHAMPPPPAGKGQGVKRGAKKPVQSEEIRDRFEVAPQSRFGSGGGNVETVEAREKPRGGEASAQGVTAADVYAFVEAYNHLLDTLGENSSAIRAEVYKPVRLGEAGGQISLYEIGVAHLPNRRQTGALSVHDGTLKAALQKRGADVNALFLKEGEGLLQRLCSLAIDNAGAGGFLQTCARIMNDRREYGKSGNF